ncbi:hypothetical protein [Desulfurivibrio alkaliphilus]|uniref:Uncharacterized protein n=1 Tax=Desulfurivibrio alkaliphilus (strain DSM 19089 / UNIQEM U267 / AHT2) TaxID=589865 RepID=D6Z1R6_DESAT|nr:hypothetical protein [Desulfurivibrio alkaliphilus]ADH85491.1 hypothetical protein DaAHT2_0787 [Desulfurivibrio alkaliphilus AHT 2]
MTIKESIRILSLSPFYYRLNTAARKALINEFRQVYQEANHEGGR